MRLTAIQNARLKTIFIYSHNNNKTLKQVKAHASRVGIDISDDDVTEYYMKFLCHLAALELDDIVCDYDKPNQFWTKREYYELLNTHQRCNYIRKITPGILADGCC